MRRPHPSDTLHDATDFNDELARFKVALHHERSALDDFDRDFPEYAQSDQPSYERGVAHATARRIWFTEQRDLLQEIDHLTLAAKARAAQRMREAGLDDVFAVAVETDDYGVLAV